MIAPDQRVRRAHPALQELSNVTFLETANDGADRLRQADRGADTVITVVNIDPHQPQEGIVVVPASARAAADLRRPRPALRRALPVADRPQLRPAGAGVRQAHIVELQRSSGHLDVRRPLRPSPTSSPASRSRRAPDANGQAPPVASADQPVVRGRAAVVQARGLLRDPHPRLLRRQRRRLGRLPRADREARLPAVAGDRLHLAAAVLRVAAARRRLRHLRLHQGPSRLRDGRGRPAADRRRPRAPDPRDRRPGDEPHLERPPVVPGVALEPRQPQARLVRVVGHPRALPGRADHLHRHRDLELDLGPGRRAPTTGTASSPTSPTSTTTTPRSRRR